MTKPGRDDLLREHGQAVWRLIMRLLGTDGPDAADCFQQAFCELAAKRDVRDAAGFLKRAAAARAIDVVRKRVRDRKRFSARDADTLSQPEVDDPLQHGELVEQLREALAELPEPQAFAFVLTQIDELSSDAAAAELKVSVNHLGVLLHRARAALRVSLHSHHPTREGRS